MGRRRIHPIKSLEFPVEIMLAEVKWYRRNGSYHNERISLTLGQSHQYVIGDWSWNRRGKGTYEVVEKSMEKAGVYVPLTILKETR